MQETLDLELVESLSEISLEVLKDIYIQGELSLIATLRNDIITLAKDYQIDELDLFEKLYEMELESIEDISSEDGPCEESLAVSLYEAFELICPDAIA